MPPLHLLGETVENHKPSITINKNLAEILTTHVLNTSTATWVILLCGFTYNWASKLFDIHQKQIYPPKTWTVNHKISLKPSNSGNCINSHYVLFPCTLYKEDITILQPWHLYLKQLIKTRHLFKMVCKGTFMTTLYTQNLFTWNKSPYMISKSRITRLKTIWNGFKIKNVCSKSINNFHVCFWSL